METTQPRTRSFRRLAAATAVVTALAIPLTGVGSALATTHPPTRAVAVAATSTSYPLVLAGKHHV